MPRAASDAVADAVGYSRDNQTRGIVLSTVRWLGRVTSPCQVVQVHPIAHGVANHVFLAGADFAAFERVAEDVEESVPSHRVLLLETLQHRQMGEHQVVFRVHGDGAEWISRGEDVPGEAHSVWGLPLGYYAADVAIHQPHR